MLHDRDTVAALLAKLAEQQQTLPLQSFVVDACREFGWGAFAKELKRLIATPSDVRGRQESAYRNIEWLSAFCCDKQADSHKSALAHELCALAVERFCQPHPPRPAYDSFYHRRAASDSEKSLPRLLKALLASECDEELSRVIRFVQQSLDEFRMDQCQVPCLKALVPWSQKRFGSVHPQLAAWLAAVRQQLASVTAEPPVPPADWARPADVRCTCRFCAQLSAFLADPASEVGRIPAREEARRHLVDIIRRHQCDVNHKLEKKGSPFSLVLTKTTGSFDRAVKRFKADRRLLKALPPTP